MTREGGEGERAGGGRRGVEREGRGGRGAAEEGAERVGGSLEVDAPDEDDDELLSESLESELSSEDESV